MIAVTGASGYIGGVIVEHLRRHHLPVLELGRRPGSGDRFALGEMIEPSVLTGVSTVVHAAWDFTVRAGAVRSQNVIGALPLLRAARAAGAQVVLISSLAAFEGCRSDYGLAKLELEELVRAEGGVSLRPGIVYGNSRGGIFGALVDAIAARRLVPLLSGRHLQRLYLSDDEDLCALLEMLCLGERGDVYSKGPLLAAHPTPISLRQMVLSIAVALERRATLVPVPWQVAYLALRAGERVGISAPFRADSVLALANPIPLSQVAQLAPSPVPFRHPRFETVLGVHPPG